MCERAELTDDERLFESSKYGLDCGGFEKSRGLPIFQPHFAQSRSCAKLRGDGHQDHVGLGDVVGPAGNDSAGRFLDAVWLVNGNGTSKMSPNSKGIVCVVVGVIPDFGERGFARPRSISRNGAFLGAACDEIDEVLDLVDTLRGQGLDLLDQRLRIGHKLLLQATFASVAPNEIANVALNGAMFTGPQLSIQPRTRPRRFLVAYGPLT